MPDRLPSLIVLAAFWVPPVIAGWVAAGVRQRSAAHARPTPIYAALAAFVLVYALAWFLYNVGRMPPYIPGATMDPTVATTQATMWLGIVTAGLILPGSAIACVLAYRRRLTTQAPRDALAGHG